MKEIFTSLILITLLLLASHGLPAQILDATWKEITHEKENDWYGSDQAIAIAENVLLYQRDIGGWPKNVQMHRPISKEKQIELCNSKSKTSNLTIDNGATTQEMIFLSKVYAHHSNKKYKDAFLRGLEYLLAAQYDNGGWPQYYPLRQGYYTHITYNDDAMVNVLQMLQNIISKDDAFAIEVSAETIHKAQNVFDNGIACILKTQYVQSSKLTAWCAQHDENTLMPAKARSYELPSLSGSETIGIIELLMSLENPSDSVINAINSAMEWIDKVKILGLKEIRSYDNGKVINKVMVKDSSAEPLWARFMELENNTPFFCDRDGIKKYSVAEIGAERRNGYKWYTTEPAKLFKIYSKWKKKHIVDKQFSKKQ